MSQKQYDLNLINVFLEVYRFRSITLAAEALSLTQPAVSNSLKRFREQVGQEIFIRDGRGISPTSTADYLATEFSPIIQKIDSTFKNLEEFDINKQRVFNVLLTEPMSYLLATVLPRKAKFGNCRIKFTLSPSSQDEVLQLLSLRKFDAAIDVAPCENLSFVSSLYHQDDLVVLCAKNHPRISDCLNREQYLAEEHIAVKMKRSGLHVAEFFSKEVVLGRKIAFECDSILGIFAYTEARETLGFTTQGLAKIYADKFNLKYFVPPVNIEPVSHYLIQHSSLQKDPGQKWLTKILKESIEQVVK